MSTFLENILAKSFICAKNVLVVGDDVKLSADGTVAKITAPSALHVGRVAVYTEDAEKCTVATKFRDFRNDRVAGEAVTFGPFVLGADGKVYSAVAGEKCEVEGDAGPFAIVGSTSDVVGVKYKGGSLQSFTLTAGSARTIAQICADINATASGFKAISGTDAKLTLVADEIGATIEVTTETHTANTVLGLTAAVYYGKYPSHDPSMIAGLVVTGGSTGDTVETIEY